MARVAEPNPWRTCLAEREASEPPACPYCGNEVAEEGDHCSALCAELSAYEADADFSLNLQRESEV